MDLPYSLNASSICNTINPIHHCFDFPYFHPRPQCIQRLSDLSFLRTISPARDRPQLAALIWNCIPLYLPISPPYVETIYEAGLPLQAHDVYYLYSADNIGDPIHHHHRNSNRQQRDNLSLINPPHYLSSISARIAQYCGDESSSSCTGLRPTIFKRGINK